MLTLHTIVNKINFMTDLKFESVADFTALLGRVHYYKYNNRVITNYYEQKDLWEKGYNLEYVPGVSRPFKDSLIKEYRIPKKNSKVRVVIEYVDQMKTVQDALFKILSPMVKDNLPEPLVGCREGISISDINETIYQYMIQTKEGDPNKRINIGHVDVRNFFDTINVESITKFLSTICYDYKADHSGRMVNTAAVLAEIMTYRGRLPQGNPCSPFIANGVASITWAPDVITYCDNHNLLLRVYVDDIIIVSDKPLQKIQDHLDDIDLILRSHGFSGHKKRKMSPKVRQQVLGQVVNYVNKYDGPRVPRPTKNKVRTILFKGRKKKEAGEDRYPILIDWAQMYDGSRYRELSKKLDPESKAILKIKFYRWLLGQINWIGQSRRDKLMSEKMKEEAKELFDPKGIG